MFSLEFSLPVRDQDHPERALIVTLYLFRPFPIFFIGPLVNLRSRNPISETEHWILSGSSFLFPFLFGHLQKRRRRQFAPLRLSRYDCAFLARRRRSSTGFVHYRSNGISSPQRDISLKSEEERIVAGAAFASGPNRNGNKNDERRQNPVLSFANRLRDRKIDQSPMKKSKRSQTNRASHQRALG